MPPVNLLDIDDALAEFLAGPVAIVVAASDGEQRPQVVRGYAAGLSENGLEVSVHVPSEQGQHLLEAIEQTGLVAAVFSRVRDYRTYQIKGINGQIGSRVAGDTPRLAAYRDGFLDELAKIGLPRESTRGFAFREFIELRFTPTDVFAQTPGPNAGRKLEARS